MGWGVLGLLRPAVFTGRPVVIRRIADPPLAGVGYLRTDLVQVGIDPRPRLPCGPLFDGWRDGYDHVAVRVNLVPQRPDCRLPHVVVHFRAPELAAVLCLVGLAGEGVDQLVAVMLVKRLPPRLTLVRVADAADERRIRGWMRGISCAVECLDHRP